MNNDMKAVLDSIVVYFGEEYRATIEESFKKVNVDVVRENECVLVNEEKLYVGKEPICVKEDNKTRLIFSESILEDKSANVLIVHELIHSLGSESLIVKENDLLNEVVVDYFAEKIAKNMEKKGINLAVISNPVYESSSSYRKYFPVVKEFCDKNKSKIIKSRLFEGESIDDEVIFSMLDSLNNETNLYVNRVNSR